MKKSHYLFIFVFFSLVSCGDKDPTVNFQSNKPTFMSNGNPYELDARCNMEKLNDTDWGTELKSVNQNKAASIKGWALDLTRSNEPDELWIYFKSQLGSEYYAKATLIEGSFELDGKKFKKVRYTANLNLSSLPQGTYDALIVMNANNHTLMCASGRKLSF